MKTIVFVPVLMPGMPWALAPEFFVLGVLDELPVFQRFACFVVKDRRSNESDDG
jgi:hypothetical protein